MSDLPPVTVSDCGPPALDDAALAASIARSAAAVLVQVREQWTGDDQRALKDAGDAAAQAHIAERLTAERPDDAVLSEEARDSAERLSADRVWIIDPLDGTREFSEGRDDWAVHVALWQRDETAADHEAATLAAGTLTAGTLAVGALTVGAVALGGPDRVLDSSSVSAPPQAPKTGALRLAVSRSRPPALVDALTQRLGAQVVPMGSAGVKISAVVTGAVDAYVHGGGQFEWDSAAPVAVARAAGLHASRLDGSPLVYNRADPYLPDLVVCRPESADEILTAIAAVAGE